MSSGVFPRLLITAGSDVTNINRWNPKEKHKRDNIDQAAGYSESGYLGTRRCGAAVPGPASWSRSARPGVRRWDLYGERGILQGAGSGAGVTQSLPARFVQAHDGGAGQACGPGRQEWTVGDKREEGDRDGCGEDDGR